MKVQAVLVSVLLLSCLHAGAATGDFVTQATPTGIKGVWPEKLTPGNLYFVLDVGYPHHRIPFMVAAKNAQEAINRLERAKTVFDRNGYTRVYPTEFKLVEGGECKGRAWGAVINGHLGSTTDDYRVVWGGGCGQTPAQAIEAAFAACRRNGQGACESGKVDGVHIALSGSPSNDGKYNLGSMSPPEEDTFGSLNAYSRDPLINGNHSEDFIQSAQDAISMLGKVCAYNLPCYIVPGSAKMNGFEQDDAYYVDKRLTENGYGGPLPGSNALASKEAVIGVGQTSDMITTASGLKYQVISPGSGRHPKASDIVRVNYKGTLLNGEVFDSSYIRGEPTTFRLDQVIQGWTEGVQLMRPGSKFRFTIPPALAYGQQGAGDKIGPNETLIFEVELLAINPK